MYQFKGILCIPTKEKLTKLKYSALSIEQFHSTLNKFCSGISGDYHFEKLKNSLLWSVRVNQQSRIIFSEYTLDADTGKKEKFLAVLQYDVNHNATDTNRFTSNFSHKSAPQEAKTGNYKQIFTERNTSNNNNNNNTVEKLASCQSDFSAKILWRHGKNNVVPSLTQQSVLALPLREAKVIYGPPGSGKTLVCLKNIERMLDETTDETIFYIAKSKRLCEETEKLYRASEPASERLYDKRIQFMTQEAFFQPCYRFLEKNRGLSAVGFSKFQAWIRGIPKQSDYVKLLKEFSVDNLYAELQSAMVCEKEQDFVEHFKRESVLERTESKKLLYAMASEYRVWLTKNNHYDKNLILFDEQTLEQLPAGLPSVDEFQNFSKPMFVNLTRRFKEGIRFYGDPLQSMDNALTGSAFLIRMLKLTYPLQRSYSVSLAEVFRSPDEVLSLVNVFIHAINHLIGGSLEEGEYQQLLTPEGRTNKGEIRRYSLEPSSLQNLRLEAIRPDTVILISNKSLREQVINELGLKTEDKYLIFSIDKFIGCEAKRVLAFRPVSSIPGIKQLAEGLRDFDPKKQTKSNNPVNSNYRLYFNLKRELQKVNTLLSRVAPNGTLLFVEIDPSHASYHACSPLLKPVDELFSVQTSKPVVLDSTAPPPKEISWESTLIKYYSDKKTRDEAILRAKETLGLDLKTADGLNSLYARAGMSPPALLQLPKPKTTNNFQIQSPNNNAERSTPDSLKGSEKSEQNILKLPKNKKSGKKKSKKNSNAKKTTNFLHQTLTNKQLIALKKNCPGIPVNGSEDDILNWVDKAGNTIFHAGLNGDFSNLQEKLYTFLITQTVSELILEKANSEGNTPVFIAVRDGLDKKWLVQYFKNPGNVRHRCENEETLLHAAVRSGRKDLVQLVLEKHDSLCYLVNQDGENPLSLACILNNWDAVHLLIQVHPLVNHRNRNGETPYDLIFAKEPPLISNTLINSGPEKQFDMYLLLQAAFRCSDYNLIKNNISGCVDTGAVQNFYMTAIKNNQPSLVNLLLDHNVDVNGSFGFPHPLLLALNYHASAVVPILARHKDLKINSEWNGYPLVLSLFIGESFSKLHVQALEIFYERGAILPEDWVLKQNLLSVIIMSDWTPDAKEGAVNLARKLLKSDLQINAQSMRGSTLLDKAIRKGFREMVRLLIEHGANPNNPNPLQPSPLYFSRDEAITRMLLEAGANPIDKKTLQLLITNCSASNNHVQLLGLLLEKIVSLQGVFKGGSFNWPKDMDYMGILPVFKTMFEKGAEYDLSDGFNIAWLVHQILFKKFELLTIFFAHLKIEGDFNLSNPIEKQKKLLASLPIKKEHILWAYVLHNSLSKRIAELLSLLEIDLSNYQFNQGNPLHSHGLSTVGIDNLSHFNDLLIKKWIKDKNTQGDTPLHLASENLSPKGILPQLLKYTEMINEPDSNGLSPLMRAMKAGAYTNAELLLKSKAHTGFAENSANMLALHGLFAPEKQHTYPLHNAIKKRCIFVATWLINAGAELNAKGAEGETALFHALAYGAGLMGLLLDLKADIHAVDSNGKSLIAACSEIGTPDSMQLLLKSKASLNGACLPDKTTVLQLALRNKKSDMALLLIKNGADLQVTKGETLLQLAVNHGDIEVLNALLSKRKPDEPLDIQAFNAALSSVNPKVREAQFAKKIIGLFSGKKGRYQAFISAMDYQNMEICRVLLKKWPSLVHKTDKLTKKTLLHEAMLRVDSEVARLLLENGASAYVQCESGATPMEWCTFDSELLLELVEKNPAPEKTGGRRIY